MIIKRALLLYLSFSIFLLAGHQDAVHHLLHAAGLPHEISNDTPIGTYEIKPEHHASCWIEDFLQHRSNQVHLVFNFDTLSEPKVQSQVLIGLYRFVLKNRKNFSKLARGPPDFTLI